MNLGPLELVCLHFGVLQVGWEFLYVGLLHCGYQNAGYAIQVSHVGFREFGCFDLLILDLWIWGFLDLGFLDDLVFKLLDIWIGGVWISDVWICGVQDVGGQLAWQHSLVDF